jgi:hypothetical protein
MDAANCRDEASRALIGRYQTTVTGLTLLIDFGLDETREISQGIEAPLQ